MESNNNKFEKKTVLPPDILLKLYKIFCKQDPLPYSYIKIPGERSFNKP